jgi:protein-L-isoaspartate(D-aspartate) O-methyltransferase
MLDFAAARRMMVDSQVRTSDVTDLRIIAAMRFPRERFVPDHRARLSRSMFPRSSDGP